MSLNILVDGVTLIDTLHRIRMTKCAAIDLASYETQTLVSKPQPAR